MPQRVGVTSTKKRPAAAERSRGRIGSMAQVRGPGARDVVGHGEPKQNEKPEYGGNDGNHRQLGAVAQVHKEQHNQSAFDGRNQQRQNDVEHTEFKPRCENRDGRPQHQDCPNDHIPVGRYDVPYIVVFGMVRHASSLQTEPVPPLRGSG